MKSSFDIAKTLNGFVAMTEYGTGLSLNTKTSSPTQSLAYVIPN